MVFGIESVCPDLLFKMYHSDVHMCAKLLKLCQTLVTLLTVACQAPLSVGFSRPEYWSGLCALSRGSSNPGPNPHLLCLLHWQVGSLPLVPLDTIY